MRSACATVGRRAGLLTVPAILLAAVAVTRAQIPQGALPLDPPRERGASVTPAFEGWYQNADGSYSFLVGYYNRNTRETVEIPIGPNNRIEPGPADQGQPTFFEIGRQWGVFVIKVPKDFGNKTITWTLVANGEKQSVPLTLNKGYPITPFKELGMGNQPPVLSFAAGGPKFTGPPIGTAATLTGRTGQPVAINVWAEDSKGPGEGAAAGRGAASLVASLSFHKYRGPGGITFDKARQSVTKPGTMVTTNATFSAPGDYIVRVQANDESGEGGGGFQCCWTNAYVKVSIQ
jgi:hypothetical protein